MKILVQDKEAGLLTCLFRWQPGSMFVRHESVDVKQTWVLSGSIVDEEGKALEGQDIWQRKGHQHTASSPRGALVFSLLTPASRVRRQQSWRYEAGETAERQGLVVAVVAAPEQGDTP